MRGNDLTLALVGSGGAGVVITGEILLKAAAKAGFYGILRKSYGPQIRGGESAAILRLQDSRVQSFIPEMHLLVALDWINFSRFQDEIPVAAQTLVICDENLPQAPPEQVAATARIETLPLAEIAREQGSRRTNMVALGLIGKLLELPLPVLLDAMSERLAGKTDDAREIASACIGAGYAMQLFAPGGFSGLQTGSTPQSQRWLLNGNDAIAYGALSAGIRFAAAYPITPATGVLEWIAQHIETLGGRLVQAEDELSAINMAIGASFGGVPALTATSGPGLSLMVEAMGLAVASEIPLVVIDVMRGGPSTGIPTKSEQADFNLAVYGMHGDAPHVVIAALDIGDCVFSGAWATQLAEALQTLVIVLSDQFLGQSEAIIDRPPEHGFQAQRLQVDSAAAGEYFRYLDTDSGISPMAVPGEAHAMYTADGLEHNQQGTPSPRASDHSQQLDKRARKLQRFDFGEFWGEVDGSGEMVIICWGGVSAAASEARTLLLEEGLDIRLIRLRLLNPLPVDALLQHLEGASRILVIEQNHSGQFYHFLKSRLPGNVALCSHAVPGPIPLSAVDIVDRVRNAQ